MTDTKRILSQSLTVGHSWTFDTLRHCVNCIDQCMMVNYPLVCLLPEKNEHPME